MGLASSLSLPSLWHPFNPHKQARKLLQQFHELFVFSLSQTPGSTPSNRHSITLTNTSGACILDNSTFSRVNYNKSLSTAHSRLWSTSWQLLKSNKTSLVTSARRKGQVYPTVRPPWDLQQMRCLYLNPLKRTKHWSVTLALGFVTFRPFHANPRKFLT